MVIHLAVFKITTCFHLAYSEALCSGEFSTVSLPISFISPAGFYNDNLTSYQTDLNFFLRIFLLLLKFMYSIAILQLTDFQTSHRNQVGFFFCVFFLLSINLVSKEEELSCMVKPMWATCIILYMKGTKRHTTFLFHILRLPVFAFNSK